MWLALAIHHVKCLGAHRAWESKDSIGFSFSESHGLMLKRLWWCCMIRDRFLAVGLGRSLQIPQRFPILSAADFHEEVDQSEVYNKDAKTRLVRMLIRLMELCNILSDALHFINLRLDGHGHEEIHRCRAGLLGWHADAQFEIKSSSMRLRHPSVSVHANLLFMFYQ